MRPTPQHDTGTLAIGTMVMTLDGALPVEYLTPGDRIVTRAGLRILRQIDTPAPHRFALFFDQPQVIYADGRQIHSDTGAPYLA
ncbi:hypothetical protein [Actibacterium ureilyticum]|uniref:hypothetical protein n=1 Tax=Actibacterium ureilyticum TaxID=1590614 RepID=UPI000BAAC82B|nr:hypothetical protein [Actibacterium ureilyticum]